TSPVTRLITVATAIDPDACANDRSDHATRFADPSRYVSMSGRRGCWFIGGTAPSTPPQLPTANGGAAGGVGLGHLLGDNEAGRAEARAVVWLASPEASYVTGAVLTVDGATWRADTALGSRPLIARPGWLLGELKYCVDQPAGAALGSQPGRQIQR
ncbi:MAG: hypothetical protein JO287_21035, partial [Pseudonocardiales bacterium]|nr:hypothetical protein [Pseudonocardiales bacterium]